MTTTDAVLTVLSDYLGTIVSRSIVQTASKSCALDGSDIPTSQSVQYLHALDAGIHAFISDPPSAEECRERLRSALGASIPARSDDSPSKLSVDITQEYDVVTARNHVKTLCQDLGFSIAEQVKIATAVSELARNIVLYVGEGRIEIETVSIPRKGVEVRAIDDGPGIPNIDEIVAGEYNSKTGMGVGLLGTQRIMDEFHVESGPGIGTRVHARKYLS
jgi:serine/threonine-protein kinase RsbT